MQKIGIILGLLLIGLVFFGCTTSYDKEFETKCIKNHTIMDSQICTISLVQNISKTDPARANAICNQMRQMLETQFNNAFEKSVPIDFYYLCSETVNASRS
jgi:hypothetical protein